MKHKIKAAVLSMCAVFLLAGAPALASPGGGGGGWEPGGALMHLVRKANLTSDQQAQIKSILTSSHAQEKALRQQSEAVHQQMADKLLASGTPTLADFSALTAQMNQVHGQQVTLGLQTSLQIRAVLTPAQVTRISQMHQQLANLNAQRQAVLQDDDVADEPMPAGLEGR